MVLFLLILIINSFVLVGWGKYLQRMDTYTEDKKNENRLFWLIIIGGIPSIIITLLIHPLWDSTLYNLTGLYYGENTFVSQFLVVGPVEEVSKFIVFIVLTGYFKSIKEPRDGMLQAASVALGFALTENIFYAMNGGLILLLVRSIITIIAHMTYAVIWGFAWGSIGYSNNNKTNTSGWYYVILALIVASLFHGASNFFFLTGNPLVAILIDVTAIALFFNIYRTVRQNSPYRTFRLQEYRTAIPLLKRGLQKYPDSYVLNKKMGIFYIYASKFSVAEKYLLKARKLSSQNADSKFYYGVARYLDGETAEGIRFMNKALSAIPEKRSLKIVNSLKKIIQLDSEKEELLFRYNKNIKQFKADKPIPYNLRRRQSIATRNTKQSKSISRRKTANKQIASAKTDVEEFGLRIKAKNRNRFGKNAIIITNKKDPLDNQGLWESMFKENPDPVILEPYYLKKGESVVLRSEKSIKK